MISIRKLLALITAMLLAHSAYAGPRQEFAAVVDSVKSYLQQEVIGLPGTVELQIGNVDPRLSLARCTHMQAFTPPGARLWGSTTVGVRCSGDSSWTIYLPVHIQVTGSYLAAARTLAQGQILTGEDFVARTGNLTQLPPGIATSPAQVIGKVMANSIASGEPLRQDMLRAPIIVQSNQPVKVVSRGPGFVVSSEGRALNSAGDGQTVQVRTLSGHVIAGTVRPGPQVEINF